ncbi:MAG TPA: GNAT family N-acetyltransferase [Solirubrobacteraceae bacterium]|nr:GNAT family N-acetyltransferase [Solirubrobacteraceae bacterium]
MDLYALSDGRVVVIRPIRADDVERLRDAHGRLSPLTRYRRFMTSKPSLSSADAMYLANIDGSDHYALVATFAEHEGDEAAPIIAVARFVRSPEDSAAAEFAIVVGDDWQGEGLGGELMGRLVDAAVTRGVRRFQATMLADNLAIHRLSERFAAGPLRRLRRGNTFEVEFDLPTRSPVAPPASPAPFKRPAGETPRAPAIIAGCAGS